MDDRSPFNLRSPRRRALALSALVSFSLTVAASAIWFDVARADPGLPGTGPHGAISSGTEHTCALFYDGTVRCWGSNALEQIGAAMNLGLPGISTEDQPLPMLAPAGSCVEDLDCVSGTCTMNQCSCACSGSSCECFPNSVCSVTDGGTGACQPTDAGTSCSWPYVAGAGGVCTPMVSSIPQVPQTPDGGPDGGALLVGNVLAVAAGDAHTCALIGGGTVWCWGEGSAGQLGTGNFNSSSLPVQVVGIGGSGDAGLNVPAIAIAAGANHTCAVLADGTAACWGDDNQAQLGASGAGARSNTPVTVSGLAGATAIVAGADHTCALLASGAVECWGGNANGQAGVGAGATVTSPTTVSGLSTATAIVAGRLHTCALVVGSTPSTSVQCWGYNGNGQLGNGSTTDSASPVSAGLSNVRSLSANGDHTCALLANGTVKCWGDNGDGETGNVDAGIGNASTNSPNTASLVTTSPAPVTGLSGVRAISSGYFHTCAVLDNGTVTCWGGDLHGQLGDNTIAVTGSGPPSTTANFGSVAPTLVTNGPQMVGGYFHNCVLGADGRANCWGGDDGYDLGDDAGSVSTSPVSATVLPICTGTVCRGATALCAGADFTCSLLSDGTVWCWGDNTYGQSGNSVDTATTVASPTESVQLGNTAVQITCDGHTGCALLSDGTVQCWGDDTWGQLGNGSSGGSSAAPQTVLLSPGTPLDEVTFIAAPSTGAHVCALRGGTSIYCWGEGAYGQAGPSAGSAQSYAVSVPFTGTAKSLGLGALHSCALASDGTAQCWGYDFDGALGDDTDAGAGSYPIESHPVSVDGLQWATAIAGGWSTTCALDGDGSLWCWGDNISETGAVGNGTAAAFTVPVHVQTSSSTNLGGGACVSAGYYDACTLSANGSAYCWGYGGFGELGNGGTATFTHAVPVADAGAPVDY